MTRPTWHRVVESVALLFCVMAIVWVVLIVDFIPSNDGPQHTFAGYVKRASTVPGTEWAHNYTPNNPLTSNGYMDLYTIAEPLFGINIAHQIIVIFVLLLWSFGWFFWIRRHVGSASLLAIVAFPLSLQWLLWIGLYPFFMCSGIIPYVLLARRRFGLHPVFLICVSVVLVMMARIHVFGAALTGLILALLCLGEARRLKSLFVTTLAGIPSLFYVYLIGSSSDMLKSSNGTEWDVPYNAVDLFLEFFLPGPLIVQASFLLMVMLATVSGVRAAGKHRLVLGIGLALLFVGLSMPLNWSGWDIVRPRLLPTAYLLIISCAVIPARLNVAVASFALLFAGSRFVWAADMHRKAEVELAPMLSIASDLEMTNKRWLYVVADGPVSPAYDSVHVASGFLHLTQMVATNAGGKPFFSHDGDPSIHHILAKEKAKRKWLGSVELPTVVMAAWSPLISRRLRDLHISSYLSSMSWLDAIALYGLPADRETFEEAGFTVKKIADSDDGHSLFVGEFVGCSWDIEIEGLQEETVVTIGFGTSTDIQDAFLVTPSGRLHVDGVPCGPSWFRVEAGCVEARTADGRVPIQPTHDVASLICHVPLQTEPDGELDR